jgi:branched-chain amino acid transport system ATP-binding protein
MTAPLLVIEDVHVVYESAILAVAGVSLSVQPGEIVALLGGNGAGKSSLLRAVSNILHAKRGRIAQGAVSFDGKSTLGLPTSRLVRAGLVQVLEGRHCFLHLSVEENLIAGAIGKGASRAETRERIAHVYELFPALAPKRRQAAGLLSGGQQQMPLLVAEIFQSLDRLNREAGLAILLAEQNAAVALRHAHRAVVLENGKISTAGSAAELRCRDDIRAAYLGLPPSEMRRLTELAN